MAEPDQQTPRTAPAPDDMHWGITYLREDIQDLRAEAREGRTEVKAEFAELGKEMRQSETGLREELRSGDASLRAEIAGWRADMAAMQESLLKRIDARFYWAVGLMATMMGVQTALTAALIKL
ncbi:MAG: hypothetical protein ABIL09_27895 [Gemmatimonadota bacterium]